MVRAAEQNNSPSTVEFTQPRCRTQTLLLTLCVTEASEATFCQWHCIWTIVAGSTIRTALPQLDSPR